MTAQTHQSRRPVRRPVRGLLRPLPVTEAVVAVLLAVMAGVEVLADRAWPDPALALVFAALITLPVGLSTISPASAASVTFAATGVQALVASSPQGIAELLALMLTVLQVTTRVRRSPVVVLLAFAALGVVTCVVAVARSADATEPGDYIFLATMLLAPGGIGLVIRQRQHAEAAERDRAHRATVQRRALAELAVRDERARIARELHDVVAHALSVVVVQAVGGRAVLTADPDTASGAFTTIEQAGSRALEELHRLLGVLRAAGGPGAGPQPGLDRLGDLVALARSAGLEVDLTVTGVPVVLSAGVELSAYRIVQEALTNAVRHAGTTDAHIAMRYGDGDGDGDGDGIAISVVNGASRGPARNAFPGSGNGILGMRERAALCGGRLDAHPTPDGGFTVEAVLPAGAR